MKLALRRPDDLDHLRGLVAAERQALQRDRYRAVLLVADEQLEGDEVARRLGRSPRFVDEWAGRYRRGGLAALAPRKPPGAAPKLSRDRGEKLKARLDAGPLPADGVCALRGKDVVRILEAEFGVKHTIGSVYSVLHRIGYSGLAPRPRHEKNDPAAAAAFKASAPLFVRTVTEAIAPLGGKARVFFADEARFGQQGTLARVWARTGSRPTAVKQTRYEWVYLYAAVEPATGESVALLAPNVDTGTFNAFLGMLAAGVKPDEHAVLIMDRAGWHRSRALKLPDCVTVLLLPPYSPELNPVENLWHHLRSHYLSNRAYDGYDHLLAAGTEAWRKLTPEALKSVCACPYLERAGQL